MLTVMRSRWLRQRLGVTGDGRDAVLAAVRTAVHERAPAASRPLPDPPLGEPHVPLDDLERLADAYPERGDPTRLGDIAAWGAAICWTVQDGTHGGGYAERGAAAAFNLAVAIFDTAVERAGRPRALISSLHPGRLAVRLHRPGGRPLTSARPEDAALVELFDRTLRVAGNRWRGNDRHRRTLEGLLEQMYRSEVSRWRDPWPAKELPVLFLCAIGTDDPRRLEVGRRLGRFVAAWDDWLDQDADLLRARPNAFLGVPTAGIGLGAVTYAARGGYRVVAGPRAVPSVADRLAHLASAVLDASRDLPPQAALRTRAVLERLVA